MVPSAYAANLQDIYTPGAALGGANASIAKFISPLINNILILGGIVAFGAIILAGFNYITGAGDKNKVAQAQNMLNYAIIGLVLIVAAYVITNLIGQLIGFNFFNQQV